MLMHEKSRANATIARLFFKECRRISLFGRLVVEIPVIIGGAIGLYPFGEIGILQVDAYGFLCRSEPDGTFCAGCGRQHDGEGIFAVLVDVVGIVFGSDLLCVGFTGRFLLGQMHFCPVVGSGCILGNDERVQVALQILLRQCVVCKCTGYGKFVALHRLCIGEEVSVSSTAPAGSSMLPRWLATYCTANALEYVAAPLFCTGTKVSSTFST